MRVSVVVFLACWAWAGDAVELKARWTAGEEISTRVTVERTATTTGDALAGSASTITKLTIVYGEKVDEVKGGRRARVRRKYARYGTESRTVFGGKDLGTDRERHPIAGKVFSFERKNNVLVPTKEVPRAGLGREAPLLSIDWEAMLPGKSVKAGESWMTTHTETFSRLTRVSGAEMECTLESVKKGRATIRLAVDHTVGKNRATFKGSMVVEQGKVVTIGLTGKVVIADGDVAETAEYKITGQRRIARR